MTRRPARLSGRDLLRVGGAGLRTRPTRVFLSALGIAIGIAAMVSVLGISASSRAEVNERLDALGTNLLRAGPGQSFFGEDAQLPAAAAGMTGRVPGVLAVQMPVVRVVRVVTVRHGGVPAGRPVVVVVDGVFLVKGGHGARLRWYEG